MYKLLSDPNALRTLYVHYFELDPRKQERLSQRGTRLTHVNTPTGQVKATTLDVEGIVTTPFLDGRLIINGKHRSILAVQRNLCLLEYVVVHSSEISHNVPRSALGGLPPEQLKELYDYAYKYHSLCKVHGVQRVEDLIP